MEILTEGNMIIPQISQYMNIIQYIGPLILTFLGFFVGAILGIISPEELRPGYKYFKILRDTSLFLIILITMISAETYWIITLLAVSGFLIAYQLKYNSKTSENIFLFAFLGLIFYFASKGPHFFIILSLIFIASLPIGTLYISQICSRHISSKRNSEIFIHLFNHSIIYMILPTVLLAI